MIVLTLIQPQVCNIYIPEPPGRFSVAVTANLSHFLPPVVLNNNTLPSLSGANPLHGGGKAIVPLDTIDHKE